VGGEAGRARVGLDTTIPISPALSAQLGGEAVLKPGAPLEASASAGLVYQQDLSRASARAQFSLTPAGIKQVYTAAAVLQPSDNLVLSPSLEFTAGPEGSGLRFSAAGAYRGPNWSALTNHTARTGLFAPNGDELAGELQAAWQPSERFSVRGGLAYKLSGGVFTGQVNAGASYFFTDLLGAGVSGSYLFQPATGTGKLALGLEGNLRLSTDLVLTGGVNLVGFSGLGSVSTAPGFFVRLDFKFDERLFQSAAPVQVAPTSP